MKTNLKAVRKAAGFTQEQASKLSGIALGTLRRWEQGVNEPDMESVIRLASLYKTTTDTILGSEFADSIDGAVRIDQDDGFVDVPLYGSIAAGTPIEMIEVDSMHPIPVELHNRYPRAFLLRVVGESMNRILPNGCYALIDPCSTIDADGDPYAVCVNGFDATIKRVRQLNNGFELVPDSTDPTYPTKTYNYNEPGTEEITVIGRVVYYVLPFDWGF